MVFWIRIATHRQTPQRAILGNRNEERGKEASARGDERLVLAGDGRRVIHGG
jgi:hypothetical protein